MTALEEKVDKIIDLLMELRENLATVTTQVNEHEKRLNDLDVRVSRVTGLHIKLLYTFLGALISLVIALLSRGAP